MERIRILLRDKEYRCKTSGERERVSEPSRSTRSGMAGGRDAVRLTYGVSRESEFEKSREDGVNEEERGLGGKAAQCRGIGARAGGTPRAAVRVESGIGARDNIEGVESDVESEMGRSGEQRGYEQRWLAVPRSCRIEPKKNVGERGSGALLALKAKRRRNWAVRRRVECVVEGGGGIGREGGERMTVDLGGESGEFDSMRSKAGVRVVAGEGGGRGGKVGVDDVEGVAIYSHLGQFFVDTDNVSSLASASTALTSTRSIGGCGVEEQGLPVELLGGPAQSSNVEIPLSDCLDTPSDTSPAASDWDRANQLDNDIRTACDFRRVVSIQSIRHSPQLYSAPYMSLSDAWMPLPLSYMKQFESTSKPTGVGHAYAKSTDTRRRLRHSPPVPSLILLTDVERWQGLISMQRAMHRASLTCSIHGQHGRGLFKTEPTRHGVSMASCLRRGYESLMHLSQAMCVGCQEGTAISSLFLGRALRHDLENLIFPLDALNFGPSGASRVNLADNYCLLLGMPSAQFECASIRRQLVKRIVFPDTQRQWNLGSDVHGTNAYVPYVLL
ncbi:hypothetical protein R3P38DRAFT_2794105 [Favolaschia claudopus]|uniref:Uncharacterized protein n=1 Tax=Favolaschia claudopus TaxID=2862362 RepID=A0AAW0AB51_9AGAR